MLQSLTSAISERKRDIAVVWVTSWAVSLAVFTGVMMLVSDSPYYLSDAVAVVFQIAFAGALAAMEHGAGWISAHVVNSAVWTLVYFLLRAILGWLGSRFD